MMEFKVINLPPMRVTWEKWQDGVHFMKLPPMPVAWKNDYNASYVTTLSHAHPMKNEK